jgi:asparagine synthase (glutamine-hydrolysing)
MCGICGVLEYRDGRPVSEATVAEMLGSIRHRGPDDEGMHLDGAAAIGTRRLSIIDVVGGRQPLYSEDRSIAVVCNGEIYNYRQLRDELRGRGHTFATESDCEVIAHLYEDRGEACVHELRGMFAFAVWDARRRKLFLARDRLGIKPLYYTDDGARLVFGSEIKAILRHPSVVARPNLEAVSNFLSLKYVPAPQTMFEDIAALPPGHTLACERGRVRIAPYWDLSFRRSTEPGRSEEEYAEELEALLREAVGMHLMSDVPFGAFLSGGVDSSTIVALMSELLDQPVKTFSVGFEGAGEAMSELPYARMVADRYETDHHEVLINSQDFLDLSERVVWHLDQPIADPACLANYMVAELAAQHVKMVLTGEGGDELFAGYARYAGEVLAPFFGALPRSAKSLVVAASGRFPRLRRPKIALYALAQPDELRRFVNWFPLFNPEMKAELLASGFKARLNGNSPERVFAEHLARTDATDALNRMLYVDTKLWLPDDLLARGDKTSMAASLEARVPLLDHKVVEFAAALPPGLKLRRLTRKYLLKRVSRTLLPAEIIDRKKEGFPMPMSIWFRGEARAYVRDLLSPETVKRRGLFEAGYVQRLITEHETGFADHAALLWGLLGVELWQRLYIDSPSGGAPGARAAGMGAAEQTGAAA